MRYIPLIKHNVWSKTWVELNSESICNIKPLEIAIEEGIGSLGKVWYFSYIVNITRACEIAIKWAEHDPEHLQRSVSRLCANVYGNFQE